MEVLQILIIVVGTLGVIKFYWWNKQISKVEQIKNFHQYSMRYQELCSDLVTETNVNDEFDVNNPTHRSLVVKFFMLFSEEHYLAEEAKLIPK